MESLGYTHHFIKYEIVAISIFGEKLFEADSYMECMAQLNHLWENNKHLSIDVVLYDGDGVQVFRKSVTEISRCDGDNPCYLDRKGWFFPFIDGCVSYSE